MEPCTAGCFLLGIFRDRKSELERVYPEIRNLKNIPPVQYVAYVDELEQFTAKKQAWEIHRMKMEREDLLKTTEMATASLQGIMKAIKKQKKMLNEVRGVGMKTEGGVA
jgi:flagellar motor switch protein FliG